MRPHILKLFIGLSLLILFSCDDNVKSKTVNTIPDLKRGDIIACAPGDSKQFGSVSFSSSIPDDLKADFNMAVALLHSFEYDEAEKIFAGILDKCENCAMAYWGIAMSNFHPLWAPPLPEELKKGKLAVDFALAIPNKTERETEYINAIGKFYDQSETLDHKTRVLNFEVAMEDIYRRHSNDIEAAIFYSLALNAAADPTDKTYARQKKAIGILNDIFRNQPQHPGVAHYIIHNSDYPALAELALPAARKYASIAPASAHAQHMPSHIFTRLGLWDECIQSNIVSVESAKCYAEQAGIKGHWEEEMHALDYLVYGYLQKGDDKKATEQFNYLKTINNVWPQNFKTAYAFASIPARFAIERKMWDEATAITLHPSHDWKKYPWQKSIFHFTRLVGAVNIGNIELAERELDSLRNAYEFLSTQKDKAKEAAQVAVQIKAGEGWIAFNKGNYKKALELMQAAAAAEDGVEKHPVTPCEVYPAREMLADLLILLNQPKQALAAYEEGLKLRPKRFNGLYGAGVAAEKSGDQVKARKYFTELLQLADSTSTRRELSYSRNYLAQKK